MRNGYGHMMLDYMVDRVRAMRAERRERLAAVRTPDDVHAYQTHVREAIRTAFAPLPPKTPLNARVTGRIERPTHTIEKVFFESRPGCLVTGNLYLPRDLRAPAPCVVAPCGHTDNGKAGALYQAFCQRLAYSGFVVLIYDPFNQGERDQYALLDDRESVRQSTHAHNMMGKQLELLGESFATWRAWDGIRALDYLLSRPEVDPARVGVTGNSGGGTLSTWLWALDERLTMAAPSCFITTFLHNLENELPADAEQYPYGLLGAGLEMADLLIARAPEPVAILGQHYDYFDRRGHQEACEEVRRVYDVLGAPEDRVICFRGPHPHGYHVENQRAMLDFFCLHAGVETRWLKEPEALPDEDLWATPEGNVVAAGATPVYSLIAARANELSEARPTASLEEMQQSLRNLLALPGDWDRVPHYRNLRPGRSGDDVVGRYAVETEGTVRAILHKVMDHPERAHALEAEGAVRLYLPHYSAEEDLANDPWVAQLCEEGELYALDVRGLGESAPDEDRSFWHPYGVDYMMHGYMAMFGESYLGRRVYDVLRTVTLLRHVGAEDLRLYGRGQGALLALYAAILDPTIASATLSGIPTSYQDWATTPLVDWPAASVLRGALAALDIPECIQALGERACVVDTWGPRMGQPQE